MKHRDELLAEWIAALSERHLLMGDREAITSELGHWLTLVGPTAAGDSANATELYKLVAFHARQLGFDGRPASATIGQLITLDEVLKDEPFRPTVREMMKVAADHHALGLSEKMKLEELRLLREASPVVRIRENTVAGFLIGAIDADNLDALAGRTLRAAAMWGAKVAVIDVSGAGPLNALFARTMHGFLGASDRLQLVLTGVLDVEGARRLLADIDMSRVALFSDIHDFLGGSDGIQEPRK